MKKKYIILSATALITTAFVSIFLFKGNDFESSYDFVMAERGELVQEVSVIGRVVPSESVNLAFEKGGRIQGVFVEVGDTVYKGQLLVRENSADIVAQLDSAKAGLAIEQAKLDELKRGSREEEINVARVKVANADSALLEAEKKIADTIAEAFTKSDNAIRNNVDQFFSNPYGSQPELNFTLTNLQLKRDVEGGRLKIEQILNSWRESLKSLFVGAPLSTYSKEASNALFEMKTFLDDASLAVNSLTATANISQTTIDGYKTDVSTARTNINLAISNLSASEEKLQLAESALALVEQELVLAEADTEKEKVTAQEAKVAEATANIKNFEAQLSKTSLYSPISGIVTVQDAKVGEIAMANEALVTLISVSAFEIDTNIPEADVAKIKLKNKASVTLDAYGDDIYFFAEIVSIDPAETIVEGVSTYKTTLQFLDSDGRIKSGMTANIDIQTEKRSDVVTIPGRAVISKDGKKIVRVLSGDTISEVPVVVGIKGVGGIVEIVSGISEGDKVVVFIKN